MGTRLHYSARTLRNRGCYGEFKADRSPYRADACRHARLGFPLVQPSLYATQIAPVVYLLGVLLFAAGLAVVRAHSVWVRYWTVLVTLTGWFFLVLGLLRMFSADQFRQAAADVTSAVFMVLGGFLLIVALVMTYQGYRRTGK